MHIFIPYQASPEDLFEEDEGWSSEEFEHEEDGSLMYREQSQVPRHL